MNFRSFLKEKIFTIILLIFSLITIEIFLLMYNLNWFIKAYIPICIILVYIISILVEYFQKRKFYKNLIGILDQLEPKYLITEMLKAPDFIEGKILKEVLEQTNKSMIENINKYKFAQEEYKEYIETWIHEVKLPIATSKMIIENNKTEVTKSIEEELEKIEEYIEQALYYARSNTVEKDYIIKKNNLKEIVNTVIKKNKTAFLQEKIKLDMHDLEKEVYTDSKWTIFILNQVIGNSIKYIKEKEENKIEIFAIEKKEQVILVIKDNGIGIPKGEIPRVFEKGFTGSNGRITSKKSTGLGLYLCKKLTDKLGLKIELNSEENKGTMVKITFPKNSYMSI